MRVDIASYFTGGQLVMYATDSVSNLELIALECASLLGIV